MEQLPVRSYVAGALLAVVVTFTGTLSYGLARHKLSLPAAPVAEAASGSKPAVAKTQPAPSKPVAAQKAPELTHQVQAGETLAAISRLYQIDVAAIKQANGLKSDRIQVGQVLALPGAQPVRRVTVEAGDSLWELATRYGTSVEAFLTYNPDVDPGHLQIGEALIIPSGASTPKGDTAVAAASPLDAALKGLFIWPVHAPISSLFGPRDGKTHQGLDLAANMGETVEAARDGEVTYSGWIQGYGNTIILHHPDGTETLYAHASKLLVQVGARVKQGDPISLVGSTGHSTGPHLHFEIHVNNKARDPLLYLPKP